MFTKVKSPNPSWIELVLPANAGIIAAPDKLGAEYTLFFARNSIRLPVEQLV